MRVRDRERVHCILKYLGGDYMRRVDPLLARLGGLVFYSKLTLHGSGLTRRFWPGLETSWLYFSRQNKFLKKIQYEKQRVVSLVAKNINVMIALMFQINDGFFSGLSF